MYHVSAEGDDERIINVHYEYDYVVCYEMVILIHSLRLAPHQIS